MKPISERNSIGEILEIPPNFTIDQAKANYKRLIKRYHPDICKEKGAEEYVKKLNWAMGIVSGKIKPQAPPPPPRQAPIEVIITYSGSGTTGGYGYGTGGGFTWTYTTRKSSW